MDELITDLRDVAGRLADELPGPVLFPGWDTAAGGPLEADVRFAARAIAGRDDPDSGVRVTPSQLGALVRYIADMLEE